VLIFTLKNLVIEAKNPDRDYFLAEFLDRVADLVPPPRKHRHRYHGVFAPNQRLRKAFTSLAIGNIGKRGEDATGGGR
jgi:hypothetical protein